MIVQSGQTKIISIGFQESLKVFSNQPEVGVPGITPPDIPGLQMWFDGADISSMFKDPARTDPVTADGDLIAALNDKSGQDLYVDQGTTNKRPEYKANIRNGNSAILFNGTSTALRNFSRPIVVSQPDTIIVVAQYTDIDTTGRRLTDGGNSGGRQLTGTNNGDWFINAGLNLVDGADDNLWHVFVFKFNSASSVIRIDGTDIISGQALTTNLDGICIGATWSGAGNYFDGYIAEVIVYSNLSDANRDLLETQYLNPKWGF